MLDDLLNMGTDEEEPDAGLGEPIEIEGPDGTITISFGDPDAANEPEEEDDADFDENLAESLDDDERKRIAEELLEGIEADERSRQEWIDQRTYGLELLGLDPRRKTGVSDDGNATVDHPLLLEAVLRFQANARGELLPVDGPAKVRDDTFSSAPQPPPQGVPGAPPGIGDNGGPPLDSDDLSDVLELAINHFLTKTATEYYPDTDRMLFQVGFGGTGFKKVYHCPLRVRPVSEMVDADDLIVSNDATDLQNAARITQRILMRQPTLRRMQLIGAYRDIELGEPDEIEVSPIDMKIDEIQGTDVSEVRTEDRERTVYECYCELDIKGHEHMHGKEPSGLALPYKVTIDKSSREVLEIRRNYDEPDEAEGIPLPIAKRVFVKYSFVPGLGFYDLGLLHILGNSTRAATAAWRIMLDAGMRAVFPGGFVAKSAGRNNTVNFRGKPGEFIPVEAGGMSIDQIVSPFPFRGPDAVMMQLVENIVQTAERVGGTAESNVGEGRADAPVGTTLALLEQQKVILDAVHKRMHSSQEEELELIVDRLRESPDVLWRGKKSIRSRISAYDRERILAALDDLELVPVADPNTASHLQRVAAMQAVEGMAEKAPGLFNVPEIAERSLQLLRIPNYQKLLSQNPTLQPPPDPVKMAQVQVDQQMNQIKLAALQQKDGTEKAKLGVEAQSLQASHQLDTAKAVAEHHREMLKIGTPEQGDPNAALQAHLAVQDAQTRRMDAETRQAALAAKVHDTITDASQQQADRHSENAIAALNTFKDLAIHKNVMADNEAAREAQMEAAKLAAKSRKGAGE